MVLYGVRAVVTNAVGFGAGVVPAQRGQHPALGGLGRQQGVGLGSAVAVAGQAQREVVVLQAQAQRRACVEVPDRVRPQQQVPGDLAGPGLRVDQVQPAAGGQSSQLRQNRVDGALQRGLGRREVRGGGVVGQVPGARVAQQGGGDGAGDLRCCLVARGLQGCDGRLGRVEPAVCDGQGGVEGRLLHVSKQGGGELLVHVRRRGAKCHGRGEARPGLGRGEAWLDRTLRIPRTPEGLAPPPDEAAVDPQIIGRPSEVEPLLERAGQRAAVQEDRSLHPGPDGRGRG